MADSRSQVRAEKETTRGAEVPQEERWQAQNHKKCEPTWREGVQLHRGQTSWKDRDLIP